MMPGDFIHVLGDTHTYVNQVDLFKEQMERDTREYPVLLIRDTGSSENWDDIDNCKFDIFGYTPHPKIEFPPPAV
jgi:thymidylate synthase